MSDAAEFLGNIVKSGLYDLAAVEALVASTPTGYRDNAAALAEHWIEAGLLTRFQANKLRQGATFGLVLGPYRIQTPIGRGGMGVVYLASDSRNPAPVALKVLPPSKAKSNQKYLERFLREMELSRKLSHPNIARTIDVGVHGGVYFLVMEYIPGQSLQKLVQKQGPLEVARAARIFSEVAAALAYAHGKNLIHRDLKPSNIMITPEDQAKVLDLGLAMIEGEEVADKELLGGKGYLVGSVDYIAPEQTRNAAGVDARADLYSLGCALFFSLAGKPPFPGATRQEKVQGHRHSPVPSLARENPLLPEAIVRLVQRCMAKKPEDRPASAVQLRQELSAFFTPGPALVPDKGTGVSLRKLVKDVESTNQEGLNEPLLFLPSPRLDSDGKARQLLILLIAGCVAGGLVLILFLGWLLLG